jgi:glycosyltransferase involved in cell wall biosynthesis
MIFSVIVPFLNEEKYIRRCIESLLDQDFDKGEYELIFIDNGSSDSSGKIVEEFNEVTLLREDRQNVYAARNVGLKVAKGDIIAFTDADCDVAKDWLSRIHKGMSESGAVIAMGNVSFAGGGKGALRFFQDYQNAKSEYILNMGMKDCYYGYTNNMAVRASVFKELGPFMEWPVPGDTELV